MVHGSNEPAAISHKRTRARRLDKKTFKLSVKKQVTWTLCSQTNCCVPTVAKSLFSRTNTSRPIRTNRTSPCEIIQLDVIGIETKSNAFCLNWRDTRTQDANSQIQYDMNNITFAKQVADLLIAKQGNLTTLCAHWQLSDPGERLD
ncbi:hypothetical protein SAMN06265222_103209 [Neorhodopirellula lusitana]|uniref:Uncharacterized protein n=1 Tax=Neorhodopirellula lusitana TaxID=445327 RepID=A0ABY1PW77_9BACT|nr:hypothetical protein SAMN06265222_103209 [Neorhodopirellula lusitana]